MRTPALVSKIFPFIMCLLLAGCASGIKSYQRGDYYQACEEAVNRLRSSPNNGDARTALMNAYPLAKANAERDIATLTAAGDLASYEKAVSVYDRMGRLADDIRHCPAALALIPNPSDYAAERLAAARTTARLAYDAGAKALAFGTLEKAREAYDCFVRAERYAPGYKDVQEKIAQARYDATLRVIVMRPQLSTKYQLNGDFFYNRLMTDITKRTYKYLVRFYTPEEAAAEGMANPHQILELNFVDFTVGNTREVSNTTDLTRDDVEVATTMGPNGVKQPVKGTVKAKYTSNRIEVISQGTLGMRTMDAFTGRVLIQKNHSGKYVWEAEWATFNGDERALTSAQLALTKKRAQTPPPAQDLFSNFANPLYKNCTDYISAAYSR